MTRAVVLAALLLVAGCSGFAAMPGPTTETLTPAPLPADGPRTTVPPAAAADRLVPGVTRERVVDPFSLVDAHITGVTAASYSVRRTTTVRTANGSLRTRRVVSARVESGGERYRLERSVAGPAAARVQLPPGRFDLWTDGERFLSAFTPRNGSTTGYARIAPDRYLAQRGYYGPPPTRGSLLALLSAFEVRPALAGEGGAGAVGPNGTTVAPARAPTSTRDPERARADDGATAGPPRQGGTATTAVAGSTAGYRLIGETLVRPSALSAVGPGDGARNASLALSVDHRGRVRGYDLRYTATIADEPVRVAQRTRYELGGVRVDRPAWYESALDATNGTATGPAVTTPTGTPAEGGGSSG